MKKFLLIFIILLSSCQFEQNEFLIEKIHEENPISKGNKYEFPILKSNNNKIAKEINRKLILDLLDLDTEKPHKSIFENVWKSQENYIPRLSFLEYQINRLDTKLYSVTFNTEGCGAYCEEFQISYNFDLKTGNKISLDMLFSDNGKSTLLKNINLEKEELINKTVSNLRKEKDKDFYDADERIELLEDCLKNSTINSFEYLDYKIKENKIIIFSERCSNHAMRALDEIGKFKYTFEISSIKNLLSNYGNKVLENK